MRSRDGHAAAFDLSESGTVRTRNNVIRRETSSRIAPFSFLVPRRDDRKDEIFIIRFGNKSVRPYGRLYPMVLDFIIFNARVVLMENTVNVD